MSQQRSKRASAKQAEPTVTQPQESGVEPAAAAGADQSDVELGSPGADAEAGADPDADESAAEEELTEDEWPEIVPATELPFISAGVQSDLDMRGWAGDPATGGTFRKNKETGEITYTPRQ